MKIVIERAALASALAYVGKARAKSTLAVLEQVCLVVRAGVLDVTCTNMDIWCTQSLEMHDGEDGTALVNHAQLQNAVLGSPEGALIEVEHTSGAPVAAVRAGRSSFKLRVLPDTEFPLIREVEVEPWEVSAKSLHDAMRLAQGDMYKSKHGERVHSAGEFFHVRDGVLRIVAQDFYQLVDIALGAADDVALPNINGGFPGVLLPDASIPAMLSVLDGWDGAARLFTSDRLVRMECGSRAMVSKLIDARFPAYESLPRADTDTGYRVNATVLRDALKRAGVVLDKLHPIVTLSHTESGIFLCAAGEGGDEYRDDIPAEVLGKPPAASIKQVQFLGWLERINADTVTLYVDSDTNKPITVLADTCPDVDKFIMRMAG